MSRTTAVIVLSLASIQSSAYAWYDAPDYAKKQAAQKSDNQQQIHGDDLNRYPRTVQDFHPDGTLGPPRVETAPPSPSPRPKGSAATAY